MNSRHRLLNAINLVDTPQFPCSFMLYRGLWAESTDYLDFIHKQLDLGVDAYVQIPPRQPGIQNDHYNLHGLAINYHPYVYTREWSHNKEGMETPILIKEYVTPVGVLRSEVKKTSDWPYGDHVPLLDDYLVPRSQKFLVQSEKDLDALQYILTEPAEQDRQNFIIESQEAVNFAREQGLLLAGGWGVGADLVGWIYGLNNMLYSVYDNPGFIHRMLHLIGEWNRARMKVILEQGIDLFIKRAWYENCDFWTPKTYLDFIGPELEKDIQLAHQYGAKFAYLVTTNAMPLLDIFVDLGIDVLMGVDPLGWNLEITKRRLAQKICLWGGVNGHLTIEGSSPEEVRTEVQYAARVLAPGGGFILSPVDNVRISNPRVQKNVLAMIDEWQKINNTSRIE